VSDPFDAFDRPPMPAPPAAARLDGRARRPPFTARLPADVEEALDAMAGSRGTKVAVIVELVRWLHEPAQAGARATVMQRALDYAKASRSRRR
jgi:hypothetical protein